MSDIATGNARLLDVARALRESKNPDKFTMLHYTQECGTPACALGHYISRTDLQDAFVLSPSTGANWRGPVLIASGERVLLDGPEICAHFGLDDYEAAELFDCDGCGEAQSANEAAAYIEDFVKRRAHTQSPKQD